MFLGLIGMIPDDLHAHPHLHAALLTAPAKRMAHEYDLEHVKFDVKLNFVDEAISGVVENRLIAKKANPVLVFDKGPMTIESVTVTPAATKTMKYKVETTATNIIVRCTGIKNAQKMVVAIKYSATPEAGIYFVPEKRAFPANSPIVYTQGEMEDNRYWLPTYDYPDDKATSEGIIRVPKGLSVLSNGALVDKKDVGDTTVWHWKMEKPMSTYLISLVGGKYTSIPDGTFKNKPVQIWAPEGTEDQATAAFAGTDKMIELYSKLTGVDYPWAKYAQSVVPEFMFGGMENASCTTQTIGAIFPENSKSINSAEGLNAHELAHQWFGDLITTPSWAHIWVNEGWATFMPHFWVRETKGMDQFHLDRYNTYEGCKGTAKQKPMVYTDYTVPMEMFDGNAYPGGATRMFMLMHEMGETKFWKSCKRYLETYGYKNVDTPKFFESWSASSGMDLKQFMKQWFYTKGVPNFVVKKDGNKFSISQTVPGFSSELEYATMSAAGVTRKGRFQVSDKQSVQVTAKDGETLIVDPGAWLLCDIDYQTGYSDAEWLNAYTKADNAAQKARLLNSGQVKASGEELWALEKSDDVKRALLVGRFNDQAKVLEMVDSEDAQIANQAVGMLGRFKNDEVIAKVQSIFDTTTNEALKNTAYNTLLALKNDDATAQLGWNTTTYNLQTQTTALYWWASHDVNKARDVAFKSVTEFGPGPVRLAAIGVLGMVKDKPGSRDVYNVLIKLAQGRSYAPMSAAINALATYGDKAAIPTIQARANHSLHFGRGTVAGALARLNR